MTNIAVAQQYLDAWNAHNADAIVQTFSPGGTYSDPASGTITGAAIGENAKLLWTSFADLSFDIVSIAEAGSGRVVAEWIMKGTNTGSLHGLPPTQRTIALPGVDVIDIGNNGITAIKGYFDSKTLFEQLGLQVLIQPYTAGPFNFGMSASVQSGNKTKPGAFSITTIWNKDAHAEEIRSFTRETAKEMLHMEGFIGLTTLRIGGRGITITAWEKPEHVAQLRSGSHADAMKKFWADLGDAAFTSVWVPHHINPMWVRCNTCGKMNAYEKHAGICMCGATLPDAPAYY